MRHIELRGRSVIKAITWKIIALFLTWGILYYLSGDSGESFKKAIVVAPASLVAYYFHERVWNKIHWGKKTHHNQYS